MVMSHTHLVVLPRCIVTLPELTTAIDTALNQLSYENPAPGLPHH